jgi:hypothetical protein
VAFNRALGTCAGAIDTVPANGGRERTLIAMTGSGRRTALPFDPSYSSDGKYLLYETIRCLAPHRPLVHLRTLATGREMTAPDSRHPVAGGGHVPTAERRQAEKALQQLAGEWSPSPPLPGDDEEERGRGSVRCGGRLHVELGVGFQ